jgi:hypothetical protein
LLKDLQFEALGHSSFSLSGIELEVRAYVNPTSHVSPKEYEMTNLFGAKSTTDEVLSGVNLHGKRILVTGVSAGIGIETARSLAAHGANVVGGARDLKKAAAATAQILKDAAQNGGSFELIELDLANLKSVWACAGELTAKAEPLDLVIANAGVMATPFEHTAGSWESSHSTR